MYIYSYIRLLSLSGYRMLPDAIGRPQMLSNAIKCYQMLSDDIGCYRMLRDATGCYRAIAAAAADDDDDDDDDYEHFEPGTDIVCAAIMKKSQSIKGHRGDQPIPSLRSAHGAAPQIISADSEPEIPTLTYLYHINKGPLSQGTCLAMVVKVAKAGAVTNSPGHKLSP